MSEDQDNLDISRFMTRIKRNMEDDEDDVDLHIGSTKREVFEDRGKSTKLYRQLCRGENLQQVDLSKLIFFLHNFVMSL